MKRLSLIAAILALSCVPAFSQAFQPNYATAPNCQQYFTFTSVGNSSTFDNRQAGCNFWRVEYSVDTMTVLSLVMQSAPGAAAAGTFVTFGGTVITGINPNTNTTGGLTELTGYQPWVRMRLASFTTAGQISGVLKGWSTIPITGTVTAVVAPVGTQDVNVLQVASTATVTGGLAGLLGVGGSAAAGAAVTGNPVQVGGSDGTNARAVRTDTTGRPVVVGAAADGAAEAGNPVLTAGSDGTNAQTIRTDSTGRPVAVGAGTAGAAAGGVLTVQGDAAGTPIPVTATVALPTTGGASTSAFASAASTNATSVKASAGQIYAITLINTTATLYYLRLYNLAAAPTCSSATGYVATLPIPASATGAGIAPSYNFGQAFATGIAYCFTAGPTSTDNTNAAVGVYGQILYK